MKHLIIICNENGCKKMRLLENECVYLIAAIKEYKMNRIKNGMVHDHLYKKLKSIINKYRINQYRISKIDCEEIEKQIVKCYIYLKSM